MSYGYDSNVEVGPEVLNFNTGYFAKQADGAVVVSYGETMVFASAVASKTVREGQDFFPLTVDYREKSYAAGKFPGGFIKRESRPSDSEVLISRLTDRPIRPLFPEGFINEVQIIINVWSQDKKNPQDVLAMNAASAALMVSGLPFSGPVGAVRIGRVNGDWKVNPTFAEMEESDIDLMVAGTKKAITMIEGSSKNVSEDDVLKAVELAHENIKKICDAQEELAKNITKEPFEYTAFVPDADLAADVREKFFADLENLKEIQIKKPREKAFDAIKARAKEELAEKYPDTVGQVGEILDHLDGEIVRKRILEEGKRADGRGLKDIRPIDIMLGMIPRAHGSAAFTRGETQSVGVLTLGTESDAQRLDNLEGETRKHFMLHYNFPPYSVGETGRVGGVGRREIGHGMLAERALQYIIPSQEEFPYTIRQVSEILESNGSSSMASVCSGSLSLFNAGVPVKDHVAGIAMGLILEGEKFAVLTDILGLEDHLGDMDFKVTGTTTGITAFQLDIKIEGITPEIMKVALEQAREGRLQILELMNKAIDKPASKLSAYAPKIETLKIAPDKIGGVIGAGGKVIRQIIETTGSDVNIEDDGTVTLSSESQESIDSAREMITRLVSDVEVGQFYEGTVKRIMDFGAFVEILPGKEGLCHISKLARERTRQVTDVVNIGDKVKVKVIKVDDQGRIDLSIKDALE